jgi:hypothetical protein
MPIKPLVAGKGFTPKHTREVIYAFEDALSALDLKDRPDPICDLVARTILDCAEGDFDRATLCAMSKLVDTPH